jgi:hypothetical protein
LRYAGAAVISSCRNDSQRQQPPYRFPTMSNSVREHSNPSFARPVCPELSSSHERRTRRTLPPDRQESRPPLNSGDTEQCLPPSWSSEEHAVCEADCSPEGRVLVFIDAPQVSPGSPKKSLTFTSCQRKFSFRAFPLRPHPPHFGNRNRSDKNGNRYCYVPIKIERRHRILFPVNIQKVPYISNTHEYRQYLISHNNLTKCIIENTWRPLPVHRMP